MNRAPLPRPARLRCAIYTRKSSEEGLEQSFNSLHAQREACEAYVLSQAGEGWEALAHAYDDGGISGGTMERPGLQRLLADVDAGRVDVVVVYKVDRLTRSLADFAKIVERFDARGVSFVSVTQAFNTTSSMGRLTLNVLLSFAQFEREVTGERIRDKIAASKAKGMWMGGCPPLGYRAEGRALVVDEEDAARVRHIFARYIELRSVHRLRDELEAQGWRTRLLTQKNGRVRGGRPFERGMLFHLLSNRTYLGEIVHKDVSHPGLHPAIIDADVFARVQRELARRAGPKRRAKVGLEPAPPPSPLAGRVYDDAGHRMTSVSARKGRGPTYRYYVSSAVLKGQAERAGSLPRFPAPELEAVVTDRLQRLELEDAAIKRVEVGAEQVTLRLELGSSAHRVSGRAVCLPEGDQLTSDRENTVLTCLVRLRRRCGGSVAVGPQGAPAVSQRAVDLTLAKALIRAEGWKAALISGERRELAELAEADGVDAGYARRMLRLAFLSPRLKRAVLDGSAPVSFSLQHAMTHDLPLSWGEQERMLARG